METLGAPPSWPLLSVRRAVLVLISGKDKPIAWARVGALIGGRCRNGRATAQLSLEFVSSLRGFGQGAGMDELHRSLGTRRWRRDGAGATKAVSAVCGGGDPGRNADQSLGACAGAVGSGRL